MDVPPEPHASSARGQAEEPLLQVTLVHGTWAPRATWSGEGSRLWKELTSAGARCERFAWSGHNSHAARRRATAELERSLHTVHAENPGVQHVLVAHSHGGNVALHAAARVSYATGRQVRVVTLATPFLFASRSRSTFRWHTATLLFASVYAAGLVAIRISDPDTPFGSPATIPLAVVTLMATALQTVSWLFFRRRCGSPRDPQTVNAVVTAIQSPTLELDGTQDLVDLLVIRAADDEAGGLLGAAQFAGWVGFTAARLTRPDWWFAILSVAVALLPSANLLTGDPGRLPLLVGVIVDWSFSVFFVLALLLSFPALTAMSYGLDGPTVSRFAVVTAEASPPGHSTVWQRPIRESRAQGLAHSSLYDDPTVIRRVVQFVFPGGET